MSRDKKIALLELSVLARGHILITGPPAVGKTTLAQDVLRDKKIFKGVFTYVDCIQVAHPSRLYHDIVAGLLPKLKLNRRKSRDVRDTPDIESGKMDIMQFVTAIEFIHIYESAIYVILDNVEQFKSTNMMDTIVAMDRTGMINLMFVSTEPAFNLLMSIKQPAIRLSIQTNLSTIEIPNWSKAELIDLIKAERPKLWKEHYPKFVNNVVNLMYMEETRDYRRIRTYCQENYVLYIENLITYLNELNRKSNPRGDKLSEKDLALYDITISNTSVAFNTFIKGYKETLKGKKTPHELLKIDKSVSFHMSVMIVAAYIAAYTKPSDDKRNFVRYQEKKYRFRREAESSTSRQFTMERLIQIYRSLECLSRGNQSGEAARSSSLIPIYTSTLGDIQRLEDMGLIIPAVGDGIDSNTKYKISDHVSFGYVQRLAQQIHLDIEHIHGLNSNSNP